jgi:hypothetical protein
MRLGTGELPGWRRGVNGLPPATRTPVPAVQVQANGRLTAKRVSGEERAGGLIHGIPILEQLFWVVKEKTASAVPGKRRFPLLLYLSFYEAQAAGGGQDPQ